MFTFFLRGAAMKTFMSQFRLCFLAAWLLMSGECAFAQPTQDTLYINFNSHCEESDKDPAGVTLNYTTNQAQYTQYRAYVKQIADMIRTKGAKWNYQSDWNFLLAAQQFDKGDASTNSKNLLRWMAEDNGGQIQLDPHAHQTQYNYADVAYLLDQLSPTIKSSKNAGGFTWNGPMGGQTLMGMTTAGYTWDSLAKGLKGRKYPTYTWKAEVLLGGASYDYARMQTAHGADLNHVGAWRPRDTTSAGYMNHTCTAALANLGVGGDAIVDSTKPIATVVTEIMANVRATIAAMKANKGKFFVMQIQTNQRDFSRSGYLDKISILLDSLRPLAASGQIKWATHSEKAAAWKALYNEQPNFYPFTTGVDKCSTPPAAALAAPTLLSPADKAVNQPLFTTLQWSAVPSVTLYDVHVSGDAGFVTTVLRDSLISASVTSKTIGEIFPSTTIYWRVRAKNSTSASAWSSGRSFTSQPKTDVLILSSDTAPFSVSPNPSQDEIRVRFTLARAERIKLSLYNTLGQEVASFLETDTPAGEHNLSFPIDALPQGAYSLRLEASTLRQTHIVHIVR
jgi:hypothetical protein